jgi:hypothetical protein
MTDPTFTPAPAPSLLNFVRGALQESSHLFNR